MQTQTSNTLHNAIMEAGSKDRPPMLAPEVLGNQRIGNVAGARETVGLSVVSNDDHYNVFAIDSIHPEQSKSVNDTYPIEQDAQNMIIDSLDMNYDREEIDQIDDDNDIAKERELLASLIEKLKCEINESKNRNKFLETSNKV
nr:hypothetical protein [Tanacetum cinerariifolium]